MSATQRRSGAGAVKSRFTRSAGRDASASAVVVLFGLPRTVPQMPSARISRSTVHLATPSPWSCSSHQIFRAPYTFRFSAQTCKILAFRPSSRRARADAGRLSAA